MESTTQTARVRYPAPGFKANSWWDKQFKEITLDEFTSAGKWVVLFWYPLDFTFVCPTEITKFSDLGPTFAQNNC